MKLIFKMNVEHFGHNIMFYNSQEPKCDICEKILSANEILLLEEEFGEPISASLFEDF